MRVLIVYGSKRGGTEGLARMIARELAEYGIESELEPAGIGRMSFDPYALVLVGGALYANRWYRKASAFVRQNARALRDVPVWFFSSGPLDRSAEEHRIAPVPQVRSLMQLVGALGNETFGGRLERDARGFVARRMAKTHAGDFRDTGHVQAFVAELVRALGERLTGTRPPPIVEEFPHPGP